MVLELVFFLSGLPTIVVQEMVIAGGGDYKLALPALPNLYQSLPEIQGSTLFQIGRNITLNL